MQTITAELLESLDNPEGLCIINIKKTPTLMKIVDSTGKDAYPEKFTNRAHAELRLYLLLTTPKVKKKDK